MASCPCNPQSCRLLSPLQEWRVTYTILRTVGCLCHSMNSKLPTHANNGRLLLPFQEWPYLRLVGCLCHSNIPRSAGCLLPHSKNDRLLMSFQERQVFYAALILRSVGPLCHSKNGMRGLLGHPKNSRLPCMPSQEWLVAYANSCLCQFKNHGGWPMPSQEIVVCLCHPRNGRLPIPSQEWWVASFTVPRMVGPFQEWQFAFVIPSWQVTY